MPEIVREFLCFIGLHDYKLIPHKVFKTYRCPHCGQIK